MKAYEYTERVYNMCRLAVVLAVVLYWDQLVTFVMEVIK